MFDRKKYLITLGVVFLFSSFTLGASEKLAKIIFVKGEVYKVFKHRDLKKIQTKEEALKKGDYLYQDDFIKTGQSSLAVLSFGTHFQSKMKVVQNSMIQINNEKLNNNKSIARKTNLIVNSGGAVVNFFKKKLRANTKNQIGLTLKTKTASLGVRGTTFFAYEDENSTYLNVKNGVVAMESNQSGNSIDVKSNKGSLLNKEGGVLKPRRTDWQNKVNWKLKGEMEQPQALFASMRASYDAYKDEQEFLFKKYKDENEKKLKMLNSDSAHMRKSLFGN